MDKIKVFYEPAYSYCHFISAREISIDDTIQGKAGRIKRRYAFFIGIIV